MLRIKYLFVIIPTQIEFNEFREKNSTKKLHKRKIHKKTPQKKPSQAAPNWAALLNPVPVRLRCSMTVRFLSRIGFAKLSRRIISLLGLRKCFAELMDSRCLKMRLL
jgi:hypothetical protein